PEPWPTAEARSVSVEMRLQSTGGRQADEVVSQRIGEGDLAAPSERMAPRHDEDEAVVGEREGLQLRRGIDHVRDDADIGPAAGDRAHDLGTGALLDIDIDVAMVGEEAADQRRQEFERGRGIGQQADTATQSLGELVEL